MNVVSPAPVNIISLCSGGGMLDVGVHAALARAGFAPRTVCYVERDSHAAAVLVARMEEAALDNAPVWSDVHSFACDIFRPYMAEGLVMGGIPCQPHSLAGKRAGADDERDLWPAMRRIVRETGVRWVFIENVYGFLVPDADAGREAAARRVVRELAADGFDVAWDVVSASDVGANHERQRVFLLAHRRGREGEQRNGADVQRRREGGAEQVGMGGGDLADRQHPEPGTGDEGGEGRTRIGRGGSSNVVDQLALIPSRGQRELREPPERDGLAERGGEELASGDVGNAASDGDEGSWPRRIGQSGVPAGQAISGRAGDQFSAGDESCDGVGRSSQHGSRCPSGRNSSEPTSDSGPNSGKGDGSLNAGPLAITAIDAGISGLFLQKRRPDRRATADRAGQELPTFAPARNDYAGWLRVLEADPTLLPAVRRPERSRVPGGAESVEPQVRRVFDGMADGMEFGDSTERADRLRLIGNGVVWQSAAEAFWRLWQRLNGAGE